jgi:HK97 gp10 family phage protein
MDAFEAKIKGIAEVKRAIYAYNAKLGERVTRVALRQGANVMLKQIRAAAPVKTGRLKKAIKLKNSRINRINKNGKVGLYITVSAGKNRKDPKGAYYARWVEMGYNKGSKRTGKKTRSGGVRVEGRHFVRDTFNATKNAALDTILQASEIAANRIAKELNLK